MSFHDMIKSLLEDITIHIEPNIVNCNVNIN